MKTRLRFILCVILLIATGIFIHVRGRNEILPPHEPLASLPHQLAQWEGTDVTIPPTVLEVLGSGDFLLRTYQTPSVAQPEVDLFMAYFPSQRTGDTIHSPKNCLPGAGWSPMESERVSIQTEGHPRFQANRYIVAKGDDRQLVLYWYWAHDRAVASEYWAKFYLVADSIRMNRSDGSLIRVNTPLLSGENVEAAQQRLLSVVGNLVPLLDRYVPK